ncbi:MAG: YggS family pyridoxal phosphate-dependent enzyme [Tannerella sp.]|jgi:pyridoxal phosphate enzyme (YggS family)|nr:YggS family pyridoxal phosphate-dependent enzyme [Tannerella sp.]
MSAVAGNIARIRSELPAGVTLLAVSKYHPAETLQEAYDAGQRVFGENRVQELLAKQPLLPPDIEWHFIGTLQTNKVKHIAPFIHTVQSVDSPALLKEVDHQAARSRRRLRVLLEIRIAAETSKHGFSPDGCRALFRNRQADACPHVCIGGLMGMASFTDNREQVRQEFRALRTLFDELKPLAGEAFDTLSMGMSGDYPVAVEEGSTLIRVGTSVFGERSIRH